MLRKPLSSGLFQHRRSRRPLASPSGTGKAPATAITHTYRQHEELIARRTDIHPRRGGRQANPTEPGSCLRRFARDDHQHLLTRAPAAAITRKHPARQPYLPRLPGTNSRDKQHSGLPKTRSPPQPTGVLRKPLGAGEQPDRLPDAVDWVVNQALSPAPLRSSARVLAGPRCVGTRSSGMPELTGLPALAGHSIRGRV